MIESPHRRKWDLTPGKRWALLVFGIALVVATAVAGGVYIGRKSVEAASAGQANAAELQQVKSTLSAVQADLRVHTKELATLRALLDQQSKGTATVGQILVEAGIAVTQLEQQMTNLCSAANLALHDPTACTQVHFTPPTTTTTTVAPSTHTTTATTTASRAVAATTTTTTAPVTTTTRPGRRHHLPIP